MTVTVTVFEVPSPSQPSSINPLPNRFLRLIMASFSSDPYLTPAMEAPPGLHSDLIDPPSTDYSTITICVLVIILSTPFVILRLYTRKFINHQIWWDDCPYLVYSVRYASSCILMGCDRVLCLGLDFRDRAHWPPLQIDRLRWWY